MIYLFIRSLAIPSVAVLDIVDAQAVVYPRYSLLFTFSLTPSFTGPDRPPVSYVSLDYRSLHSLRHPMHLPLDFPDFPPPPPPPLSSISSSNLSIIDNHVYGQTLYDEQH
ncbi:hypothetical protein FA13DRAFT_1735562 [Coprinellus micaceus]|uniref:Uncharacterized protein n=1 Tax=Coprinellus micaceus TaxID=71717 RepID=A0A4Y7T2M6_COPMI|nr:hypothetical protein FA13DRAFT_1735562 [Coprinellus micaceus]